MIVLKGKKVLVTGGCGFIGSHLVEALKGENSVKVIGISEHNVPGGVEFLKGDIRSLEEIESTFKGVDVVFHNAALISVEESQKDPLGYLETNVLGTVNVLEACRRDGVKKLVFSSSASVYGNRDGPCKEDMSTRPESIYALTKVMGEEQCKMYSRVYGLDCVCLRYFNVYGPGGKGVIPVFLERVKRGQNIVVFGDGEQTRDFVNIKDVVRTNIMASEYKGFGVFNVGTGKGITINQLIEILKGLLGKDFVIERKPEREGDIKYSVADMNLTKKELGFEPSISLEEGLKELIY